MTVSVLDAGSDGKCINSLCSEHDGVVVVLGHEGEDELGRSIALILKRFSAHCLISRAHDTALEGQLRWALRDFHAQEDVVALLWLIVAQHGKVLHLVVSAFKRHELAGSLLWSVSSEPLSAFLAEDVEGITSFALLNAVEAPLHPPALTL